MWAQCSGFSACGHGHLAPLPLALWMSYIMTETSANKGCESLHDEQEVDERERKGPLSPKVHFKCTSSVI